MLSFENKIFLESYFCLQKLNEEGASLTREDSFLCKLLKSEEGEKADSSLTVTNNTENHLDTTLSSSKDKREESLIESTTCEISKISCLGDVSDEISLEALAFDYVEANYNISNYYDYYVSRALKSISKITDYSFAILKESMKKSLDLPATVKKTLVLDLDETLVHCDFDLQKLTKVKKDIISFIDSLNNEEVTMSVSLRPGVREFLQELSTYYDIGLFTASVKEYADAVCNLIDPANEIFSFKLYRENCVKIGKAHVKDLRILNRDLGKVIIVDNSLYSFCNQLSNGILITSFYDEPEDKELNNILGYLIGYLAKCEDVRYVNEQVFKFQALVDDYCYQ